jgi:hypothetical protein
VPAHWGGRRAASARARGGSTSSARQLARLERDEDCDDFLERDDRERDEPERDELDRDDLERLRDGTFSPFSRASLRPMAIACLRLFTVRPERPLLSDPLLRRRIAD